MSDPKQRARGMVAAMSLQEKVSQMVHEARGISRLSIPPYNWWNEALHGVGRAGIATVFPQAIGMAAMFDDVFLKEIATAISDEVRAKYNQAVREDQQLKQTPPEEREEPLDDDYFTKKNWYRGITCWSPNINIFRDPRWGRGHETYGEDPYLTSRLGVAFVQGLQGDDPRYLKTVATPKHFAVHSGPEGKRHGFNVAISRKDLYETYLPAFKACVIEGKAYSVMSAYNAVYGVPCSASSFLLEDILRQEWGFEGFVVSDCGAVNDIFANHHYAKSQTEAAAMAANAGCDLNCGAVFNFLDNAVEKGLISEETIDRSVERLFEARIRLGMFDDTDTVPFNAIGSDVIDCPKHRALALEASRRCMVLLKNDGMLPLHNELQTLAVIGPNADSEIVLLGNYNGTPSSSTTMLAGIQERFSGETRCAKGCELTGDDRSGFAAAVQAAQDADAVVLCLGLSPELEGEEGDAYNADASGDRLSLKLPGLQEELLSALAATGKPVTVVLLSGSALDLRQVAQQANAVIQAWYPGQDGGAALAAILFGDHNPSGRLPFTIVRSDADLPDFENYDMQGRTYRYLETEPLYPFGYGLSYTTFTYSDLTVTQKEDMLHLSVTIHNSGDRMGNEIVQVYQRQPAAPFPVPNFQLCGFKRIALQAGESQQVVFELPLSAFDLINPDGEAVRVPGEVQVFVGGQQPDARSAQLTGQAVLMQAFELS